MNIEDIRTIAVAFKEKFNKEKITYEKLDVFLYDKANISKSDLKIEFKGQTTTIKRSDILFFIEGNYFNLTNTEDLIV